MLTYISYAYKREAFPCFGWEEVYFIPGELILVLGGDFCGCFRGPSPLLKFLNRFGGLSPPKSFCINFAFQSALELPPLFYIVWL